MLMTAAGMLQADQRQPDEPRRTDFGLIVDGAVITRKTLRHLAERQASSERRFFRAFGNRAAPPRK
jgi:hypothetical protein